ncbi:hypothetical protein [Halalkalibacterium halodurans]|uniref:hypothetical protein n=1 Tax=Halalkalibacterium halodurans TaxID=86665 RepID=UPI002AA9B1A8|nr:hypothetical protein [Halalkalibacterium halodurans]MDY7221210.1 hypothetical protein [Halalkalibacterium halodurans]MDY7240449.1 hypothetical protein [Halalkalibacterium halodurans]
MKRKKLNFLWIISILLILVVSLLIFQKGSSQTEKIKVEGIENFDLSLLTDVESEYLLFYPADPRIEQKNTFIKTVNETGKVIEEFEVIDSDFRRMFIHQKPNDVDNLYISLFGENRIENYYYLFDLAHLKFNKVNLSYFGYDVGVNHIEHFGEDVLFETIVSHKTGDQNYKPETSEFNVSISNSTTEKSFETEYGFSPKWAPLLDFQGKIIYGIAGRVNNDGNYNNAGVGIIDLKKDQVVYEDFDQNNMDLFPIYSNNDNAFIMGENGDLYVYDKNFSYQVTKPFKDLPPQDNYYIEGEGYILLEEDKALYGVFSEDEGFTLGLLKFETVPSFQPLDKEYIKDSHNYKILYHNPEVDEIYLLEVGDEENLLVIENGTFNLKSKIPVESSHLLDFVLKVPKHH